LSNPHEARQIADPAYREKLAEAIAQALLERFGGPINLVNKAPVAEPATNIDRKTN
jgi:hypothetical protein